jgi:hypothetical protein
VSHSSFGSLSGINPGHSSPSAGPPGVANLNDNQLSSLLAIAPSSSSSGAGGSGSGKGPAHLPIPVYSKQFNKHGIYIGSKLYENILSAIALVAFGTFALNRLVQTILVGGGRRKKRRKKRSSDPIASHGLNLFNGEDAIADDDDGSVILRLVTDGVASSSASAGARLLFGPRENIFSPSSFLDGNFGLLLDQFGLRDFSSGA